jgi:hypothetical protein
MAEIGVPTNGPAETAPAAGAGAARGKDDVALDLMKFIAVATGYGKSGHSSAGFSAKPSNVSAEEHAAALLELFERCRQVVTKNS